MGQPISSEPAGLPHAPQPLQNQPLNKKLLPIILGAIGILVLCAGMFWWLGQGAKKEYAAAAATYKKEILAVRNAMNTALEEQDIAVRSPQAPAVFDEYGKKMQDVVATAPRAPKVLFIPVVGVGQTKQQIDALTVAATNYANELRRVKKIVEYYTTVAELFKPIKDLGIVTATQPAAVKALPGLWQTFQTQFKALPPPSGLEDLKTDLTAQAETLHTEFKKLADGFDGRTFAENDTIMGGLNAQAQTFNKTYQQNIQSTSSEAIDKINIAYDKLDKLL